jgi:hypothetical protein
MYPRSMVTSAVTVVASAMSVVVSGVVEFAGTVSHQQVQQLFGIADASIRLRSRWTLERSGNELEGGMVRLRVFGSAFNC